ncbi:hypothetical protein CAPN001_10420 [Capnocytophaga stomatis]|uniref:hypothetical protein n=1 Tax=Capnocytophaga stomatis TaxID=1848904 RepID=UPI001951EEB6|nr:hypothetical protein [Capnocytophaga stomatis]GIJ96473.1 hypothetical protein CAPN001_10420 [Capnocytophaga stomatis]
MKKALFYVVFLLISTITTHCVLIAPAYDDLKLSTSEVIVEEGDEANFEIISGSRDYVITIADTEVVTATLSGTTVELKGIKKGETTITVTDKGNIQQTTVSVKVHRKVPRITFTTTKAIGEKFVIRLRCDAGAWIDLNSNDVKDEGEDLESEPYEYLHNDYLDPDKLRYNYSYNFTLLSQKVTIYGNIYYMGFLNTINGKPNLPLVSLDAKNSKLEILECQDSGLKTLNTEEMRNLKYLNCSNNNLISLNVSRSPNIYYLSCSGNKLTSLDVSNLRNIEQLYCNNNELTSLLLFPIERGEISICRYLSFLDCHENRIKADMAKKIVANLPAGLREITGGLNKGKKLTRDLTFSVNSLTEQNEISLEDLKVLREKYWSVSTKYGGFGPPQMDIEDWYNDVFPCGYVGEH